MHIFMYNLSYNIQYMLGFSSLFSLTSDPLKDTLLLYKRVTEPCQESSNSKNNEIINTRQHCETGSSRITWATLIQEI